MHKEIKNTGAAAAASDQTAKRNTSPAGEPKQIRYTPKEEEIILSIAEALRTVEKAGDKIGKLVDALVAEKGGIEYGGETIERIAAYPGINCSAQHLRKCWNLYRFTRDYGDRVSAEHKKVCRSSKYQIARLLDLEMEEKAMLVIIDECIHQTVERSLAVDEVRELVGRRLGEFGKTRRKPTKKTPKSPSAEEKNEVASGSDLVEFAERLSLMADPEQFDATLMSSPELRMGFVRMLSDAISFSRRFPESGPNQDLGTTLIKKGDELKEIGKSLLEPETKPEAGA